MILRRSFSSNVDIQSVTIPYTCLTFSLLNNSSNIVTKNFWLTPIFRLLDIYPRHKGNTQRGHQMSGDIFSCLCLSVYCSCIAQSLVHFQYLGHFLLPKTSPQLGHPIPKGEICCFLIICIVKPDSVLVVGYNGWTYLI